MSLPDVPGSREQARLTDALVKAWKYYHPDEGWIPTPFQKGILSALDGKARRTDALAMEVGDRRRLFKPGGIKELMEVGRVKWHRRVGYYRPDAPPPEYKEILGSPGTNSAPEEH